MSNANSLPPGCGFFITAIGREALEESERCPCTSKSFVGFELECDQCGTIYAVSRQLSFEPPKRAKYAH